MLGRWEDPYLTMSAQYQSVIAGAFVDFLDRGYVYKGLKPVHWCIKDRTALAEAEVEYEDHTSPSIWVRFALTSDPAKIHPDLAGRNVYGLIWTTTPWTMPANMAIAFHPKFEYVAVDVAGDVYIVAAELAEGHGGEVRLGRLPRRRDVPGHEAGARGLPPSVPGARFARHAGRLRDARTGHRRGPHRARPRPGGLRHRPAIRHRDVSARWTPAGRFFHAEGAPGRLPDELIGKTVWEANPIVIEILKIGGRAAGPREARALLPALLALPQPGDLPRHRAVVHRHGAQRLPQARAGSHPAGAAGCPRGARSASRNMIATRPDWCISRQRVWGVPIIVFYCEGCREPVTDRKILDRIVELFREHTADIWYERTAAELLPAGHHLRASAAAASSARRPTFWTSGSTPGRATWRCSTTRFGLPWPADLYLEGGDQYRGWFHSSLLVGTGLKGGSPYRACALNGWVLDGEGKAMHKSLGNAIEPEEVIKKHGAEILRLWSASVDFNEDVRMSETIQTRLMDAYRKLRNTFRYMLGNVSDFDPADGCGAGRRADGARPVDPAARRRPGGALPRLVRQLRVPQGLSHGLRVRDGGPELGLLRRAEGPAVHLGARNRRRGAARRRRSTGCWTRWCGCWRRS